MGGRVVRIAEGKERERRGRERGGDRRRTVLKGNGKTVVRNPKAVAAADPTSMDPTPRCFSQSSFQPLLSLSYVFVCLRNYELHVHRFQRKCEPRVVARQLLLKVTNPLLPKWRHPIPQVVACIAHIRSFFSRDTCNQSTFLTSSRVLSSRVHGQPSTIHILGTAHRCGWLWRGRGKGERML